MTKIQALAEKLAAIILKAHWTSKEECQIALNIIVELVGMAEALPVVNGIDDIPHDNSVGLSDDYLIDLNGRNEDFAIGFYDHANARWIIHDDDKRVDPDHMTWQRLPLARYNPNEPAF